MVSQKFRVQKSEGNYNTDIGVPLSIIGARSADANLWRWLQVIFQGLWVFLWPHNYPSVLILEMGADRVGDISYLVSFVKPTISVVTAVGPSHLEYFGKIEKIIAEKSKLISVLPVGGTAILNYDDERVREMVQKHKKERVIYFGFDEQAEIKGEEVSYTQEGSVFKIRHAGNLVPVHLPKAPGKANVYAALAAAAVGVALNLNLVEISKALEDYQSLPGRLQLLSGIKSCLILDDTYNAAPASTLASLEVLAALEGRRKIAVLGDMTELGEFTEEGHRLVGAGVVDFGINLLVTIGARAKFISDQAVHMGYAQGQVLEFNQAEDAASVVKDLVQPRDVILVKGSRAMAMEKIVYKIMAHPEKAAELLVH